MNEYFLRIADDGTQVIISSSTAEDGALIVLFQRLNIDAEAIAVELLDVHEAGAVLAPLPCASERAPRGRHSSGLG